MRLFPGKTLEELDGVDYLRLLRALEAGRIIDLEAKLRAGVAPTKMSEAEQSMIVENERIIKAVENAK